MKNTEREEMLFCSKQRAEALLQLWGAKPHAVPGALMPAHHCEVLTDLRSIADPFARTDRARRRLLKKSKAYESASGDGFTGQVHSSARDCS